MLKRLLAGLAVAVCGLAPAAAWSPAQADTATHVTVPGTQPWTDTGIAVAAGDTVSVTASGTIFIAGSDPGKTPAGAPPCQASGPQDTWVAPGLTCWSMIGRIGNGTAFLVGAGTTVTAGRNGDLFLGVNDNFFGDNSGAWTAAVTLSPPSGAVLAFGDSAAAGYGLGPAQGNGDNPRPTRPCSPRTWAASRSGISRSPAPAPPRSGPAARRRTRCRARSSSRRSPRAPLRPASSR